MDFDAFRHHRRTVRLQDFAGLERPKTQDAGHDREERLGAGERVGGGEGLGREEGHGKPCPYNRGVFYITICTYRWECLFGEIVNGEMELSPLGEVVQQEWKNVAAHRLNVTLDAFVVMPNHVHGIVIIREATRSDAERQFARPVAGSLSMVVGGFKSAVSRRINILRDTPGAPVWHRNYHERIVRDDRMLNNARRYIANNPANWPKDVNRPTPETP